MNTTHGISWILAIGCATSLAVVPTRAALKAVAPRQVLSLDGTWQVEPGTMDGIIADLTDYDQLKSGQRREAIYYGIYGIVRKTGWALCSLILALVFFAFGYSAESPLGVRVIWLVCALSCLIGLLFFIPYKLGDTKDETKEIMRL